MLSSVVVVVVVLFLVLEFFLDWFVYLFGASFSVKINYLFFYTDCHNNTILLII